MTTLFYIVDAKCISPQQTADFVDFDTINVFYNNKLLAKEPDNKKVPASILRRMNKGIRMGVSAALSVIESHADLDGIIMASSNLGMNDAISFLYQIIDYDEGLLAPVSFVNGSSNSLAAQIALLSKNHGYNITHVHRGHAFENAMIDAAMQFKQNINSKYLLGASDEFSDQNYNIEFSAGWYKKELINSNDLFKVNSEGTLIGELATMFCVSNAAETSVCAVRKVSFFNTSNQSNFKSQLALFLSSNLQSNEKIDLLISGENGDSRFVDYYNVVENQLDDNIDIIRYKHLTGECGVSSSMSLWLAFTILKTNKIPDSLIKKKNKENKTISQILIYNNYRGLQHSFMLVSRS